MPLRAAPPFKFRPDFSFQVGKISETFSRRSSFMLISWLEIEA
jgi:hypothetical protein